MIHLVCGAKGSGKTSFVIHELWAMRHSGRTLCTNLALTDAFRKGWKGRIIELVKHSEARNFWEHCEEGSVSALDECHILYNSRAWSAIMKEAPHFLDFLSHARKSKDLCWFITQRIRRVDTQLRELSDVFWFVNSTMWLAQIGWWPPFMQRIFGHGIRVQGFVDEKLEDSLGDARWFRGSAKVWHLFDSWSCEIAKQAGLVRGRLESN